MSNIGHNSGFMRDAGWYATHRDMLTHPIVGAGQQGKPANPKLKFCFSKYEAWHWLIANAAYQERSFVNKGRTQTLQPGQVVGGRKFLAQEWNWTEEAVRQFLKRLVNDMMITLETDRLRNHQRTNTANIITLCNYLHYQLSVSEEQPPQQPPKQPPNNQQATTAQPPRNHILNKETNKQINNTTPLTPQRGNADDFPSHVQPITSWSTAFAQPDQDGFVFGGPQGVQLVNGTQQFWLEQFDGDQKALGLALIKAAASVQPNSKQNRIQQIVRMLSSEAAAKHNSDQRYAKAAERKGPKAEKATDRAAIMQKILEEERNKLVGG